MARYGSPDQLALTDEIVALDGPPDPIDNDGPDDAKPLEKAAAPARLGVIEAPMIELTRDEHASAESRADAPVVDRDARATSDSR